MSVPDFMPVLSEGAHGSPSEGACVMEMVSVLAGEKFSDSPHCVHPYIAYVARTTNDCLGDDERHQLVPLIGRLFGTNPLGLSPYLHLGRPVPMDPVSVALRLWIGNESASATRRKSLYTVAGLTRLLDEYDRLTSRTEHHELTDDEKTRLLAAVG